MATTLLSKSWACLTCGWTAPLGIDPWGEYFTQKMLFMSNGLTVNGCPAGICPSCYYNPNSDQRASINLTQATDLSRPDLVIETTTLSQADIDAQTVVDTDADGNPIMVDSGKTTQTIGIVNGAPAIVDTPVMTEQMRPLTDAEKAEKSQAAQQTLDALSPNVIQEVTP
jgi:hypothetical protein